MDKKYYLPSATVIEWLVNNPSATWKAVDEKFGKPRKQLRALLIRKEKRFLLERLDKNTKKRDTIGDRIVLHLRLHPDTTWRELELLFNRNKQQVRSLLYNRGEYKLLKGVK